MNMAYCRFDNTLEALRDCPEHIEDDLEEDESKERARLIRLCAEIAADYEDSDLAEVKKAPMLAAKG